MCLSGFLPGPIKDFLLNVNDLSFWWHQHGISDYCTYIFLLSGSGTPASCQSAAFWGGGIKNKNKNLCFSVNAAVYLWRCKWLVFLLVLLLRDKYSPLYFYYYTECRHFQTSWGSSCNSPCSSVNPVSWSTIELGVPFSSYYFKINWKANHSNHFEIKQTKSPQNPQTQQLKTQSKSLYSAWLEKIIKSQ